MKRAIGNMRTTTAWAAAAALAATLALAGCVTARIDYPLGGVAQARPARFQKRAAVFVLRDARYADKRSVATFANRKGTYNTGIAFSPGLADFAAVFGGAGTTPDELWYVAPDRLYWKPGGPFDDLRDRLAEHLRRAGVFASLVVADGGRSAPAPGANATGAGAVPGAPLRLEVTLKRFISLKRRRPGIDTFGFLGVSALAQSREDVAVEAGWKLTAADGATLGGGTVKFGTDADGSCWRAKNKPFALANRAARMLGDGLVQALR